MPPGQATAQSVERALTSICFTLLAANNLVVIFDMVLYPDIDFRLWRNLFALAGISVLLYGFVWDQQE